MEPETPRSAVRIVAILAGRRFFMATPFAEEVFRIRSGHTAVFPSRRHIHQFVCDLEDLLFPHLSGESEFDSAADIDGALAVLSRDLKKLLRVGSAKMGRDVEHVSDVFFAALPDIYRRLWLDAQSILDGDPAANSIDEVISAYPGFFGIYVHRIAHALQRMGVPVLPRIIAEYAHVRTGIDIHPAATIGDHFCIDHGTGVVIGETAVLGDNVKLYHGVSLGALSVSKAMGQSKRHPTIEDNVVVYSNAVILGGDTVVGHDSVIGGNVWITESVPPYSVVYHKSEFNVRSKRKQNMPIDFSI
jgi:serine O-acetyltransferase